MAEKTLADLEEVEADLARQLHNLTILIAMDRDSCRNADDVHPADLVNAYGRYRIAAHRFEEMALAYLSRCPL